MSDAECNDLNPEIKEELLKLRAIEYYVWKVLDESTEDEGYISFPTRRSAYQQLIHLLPKSCPMPP